MGQRDFASDYYYVCDNNRTIQAGEEVQPINLPARLVEILGEDHISYSCKSMRETYSDPGRLQVLFKQQDGIFELQFLRLREQIQSEIAKANGDLEIFHLEDGDYLAESASALFDSLTSVFVLQRSYFGANSNFIQAFLNNVLHQETTDMMIQFVPICDHCIDLQKVFGKPIKGFEGKVCFDGEPLTIYNDIAHFSKYRPATVKFSVYASRARDKYLAQQPSAEQITILKNDPATRKLMVKVEDVDRSTSIIDLLSDRVQDKFTVNNIDKSNPARHSAIYDKLKTAYLKRVENSEAQIFASRKEALKHR